MASKHLRGDMNYAWPTAQIAVMGAKGAVEIIYRKDTGDAEKIAAHTKDYEDRFLSPFVAAERGYVDEVIMPHSTRRRVARALRLLRNKDLGKSLEEARQHSAVVCRAIILAARLLAVFQPDCLPSPGRFVAAYFFEYMTNIDYGNAPCLRSKAKPCL